MAATPVYVQLIAAPSIAQRPNNPRHTLLDAGRGRILAGDGTVLAQTVDGRSGSTLPGAQLAALVGYDSPRYGTSGIEGAFDRALTPPESTGDPVAQFQEHRRTR